MSGSLLHYNRCVLVSELTFSVFLWGCISSYHIWPWSGWNPTSSFIPNSASQLLILLVEKFKRYHEKAWIIDATFLPYTCNYLLLGHSPARIPVRLHSWAGLQELWNRPWAAWKQGMGEGICYFCMDVTCDPGTGQLAGISAGTLQQLLCRVIKEGVWAICAVNENRNLRIHFQTGSFNINDCSFLCVSRENPPCSGKTDNSPLVLK